MWLGNFFFFFLAWDREDLPSVLTGRIIDVWKWALSAHPGETQSYRHELDTSSAGSSLGGIQVCACVSGCFVMIAHHRHSGARMLQGVQMNSIFPPWFVPPSPGMSGCFTPVHLWSIFLSPCQRFRLSTVWGLQIELTLISENTDQNSNVILNMDCISLTGFYVKGGRGQHLTLAACS